MIGDSMRLQQALGNVLRNAVKFTARGGRIRVATRIDAPRQVVLIEVGDNGSGMTGAELARIFEPFAQGDHATHGHRRTFGGLGLGLAISRHLVELHGGRITAASPGLGSGSIFTIEVPHATAAATEAPSIASGLADAAAHCSSVVRGGAHEGLLVLLVDDHQQTCQILSRYLTHLRHRVKVAQSIAEARILAAEAQPDLLISDIGLPDGTGYELMAELRQSYPALHGVAVSGYGMAGDVERSRKAGFKEHFTKPLRTDEIDRLLAEITATRR